MRTENRVPWTESCVVGDGGLTADILFLGRKTRDCSPSKNDTGERVFRYKSKSRCSSASSMFAYVDASTGAMVISGNMSMRRFGVNGSVMRALMSNGYALSTMLRSWMHELGMTSQRLKW